MSIEIQNLRDLDPALVEQELNETQARLQELHPSLDLRRGVLHDHLLYPHSVLAAGLRTNINRYLSARSLRQIELDPTLAEDSVVEDVLSNWRLDRKLGTKARGEVTIILSAPTAVSINEGMYFEASGHQYVTTQLFTAVAYEELVNDQFDRLIVQLADGNYAFTIEVEAVEVGAASWLAKDTLIVPSVYPTNFVTAFVTSDFTQGDDAETNDEILKRLQQGIAAKGASNRTVMAAALRAIDAFSLIQDTSVIGYGDPEMLRDQHSLIPISFGGRIDWYIRSQAHLRRVALTKTATLVQKTTDGDGIWQFGVSRDESPGFYEIANIRREGAENVAGGFEIVDDIRSVDRTGSGVKPDIETLVEGAYTAFQAAVIRFRDNVTSVASLALGATQTYIAEARGMPLIGEIQALCSHRDTRHSSAETLVKAPIPCFVQVNFTIYKRSDEADPDIDGIKDAIANVVNHVGFVGRIYASQLVDVVQGFLANNSSAGRLDLFGRIRRPDGTLLYLRDDEVLRVEDDPARLVTANTVQFFLEPEDITVSIAAGIPTPI